MIKGIIVNQENQMSITSFHKKFIEKPIEKKEESEGL
jgi:hypothetical protein